MTITLTSCEHADELTHRDNLLHDAWTQIDALNTELMLYRAVAEKTLSMLAANDRKMFTRNAYSDEERELRAALDAIEVRS